MRRSYSVRIIDRSTKAALFTTIRFQGNGAGCPFEMMTGIMVAPRDESDPTEAYSRILQRLGALADLLDARRRRR